MENKRAQQSDRSLAQRDGFGAPEKSVAFLVEPKRTESVNCGDRAASNSQIFGTFSKTFMTCGSARANLFLVAGIYFRG